MFFIFHAENKAIHQKRKWVSCKICSEGKTFHRHKFFPWRPRTLKTDKGFIFLYRRVLNRSKRVIHMCPLLGEEYARNRSRILNLLKSVLAPVPPDIVIYDTGTPFSRLDFSDEFSSWMWGSAYGVRIFLLWNPHALRTTPSYAPASLLKKSLLLHPLFHYLT